VERKGDLASPRTVARGRDLPIVVDARSFQDPTGHFVAPDGRPDVASISAQQDWYAQMGMIQKKVPMDQVLDLSFLRP